MESEIGAIIWELILSGRAERFDTSYETGYLQAMNDLLKVFEPNMTLKGYSLEDGLSPSET